MTGSNVIAGVVCMCVCETYYNINSIKDILNAFCLSMARFCQHIKVTTIQDILSAFADEMKEKFKYRCDLSTT